MLLPELPMVDMLLQAMDMNMLLLSYIYGYASTRTSYGGYASTRTSYGGYASPSYGYRYVLVMTSYGGHTPFPQALRCAWGGGVGRIPHKIITFSTVFSYYKFQDC